MISRDLYYRKKTQERSGLAKLIDLDRKARKHGMHRLFFRIKGYDAPNAAEQIIYQIENAESPLVEKPPYQQGRGRGRYYRRESNLNERISDYERLFVPFTPTLTPEVIYNRMTYRTRTLLSRLQDNYIPSVLFTLNDIDTILNNSGENLSTIVGPIRWLTINPGTQMVGSFNPVTKNFYEEAYSVRPLDFI
jgi:hypothetical protein